MEDRSVLNTTLEIEKDVSSEGQMGDKKEVNDHDSGKMLDGNGVVEKPKVGMTFSSEEELLVYYKNFAQQEGFDVKRRSSRPGDDGKLRYLTLACSRSGKSQNNAKKLFRPNPAMKTQCKVKINAIFCPDGKVTLSTVVLEHNHVLSPGKAQNFGQKKKHETRGRRGRELNDQVGIIMNGQFDTVADEAERKQRWLQLKAEDIEAIRHYFVRMQDKNSSFFYLMDLDNDCQLRNLFWADGRSRAAYEAFGDVVTFETTFLENKYDLPLASFVGVNHHGQSLLLGCGLLLNEDMESFVWLFESWLACMSWQAPNAIITGHCNAIQRAVERVFPRAQHRWCLCHTMKMLLEDLRGHSEFESIKMALQNAIYDSLTIDEFDESWKRMIENYDLQKNEWWVGLYDERHRWVPVYVKETFWAGMSTSLRKESARAFFEGIVNSKTTLKQFIEQYDNALRSMVEKEDQEDYNSLNSCILCITHYDIERQFQEAYTNAKFREFQEELKGKIYCFPSLVKVEGSISTYEVGEDVKIGERTKDVVFSVYFNEEECEVQCTCRLFEFKGILCRHAIAVLTHRKVNSVPHKYILERWRKDLKRKHTSAKVSYDDSSAKPHVQRFTKMCDFFYEVADMGAYSDEKCMMVMTCIHELKEKLCNNESACGSQLPQNPLSTSLVCCHDLNWISMESGGVAKTRERKKKQPAHENDKQKGKKKKGSQTVLGVEKDGSDVPLHLTNTSQLVNEIGTEESMNANLGSLLGGGSAGLELNYCNSSQGHPRQFWSSAYEMENTPSFHGNQLQGHPSHFSGSEYVRLDVNSSGLDGNQLESVDSLSTNYMGN